MFVLVGSVLGIRVCEKTIINSQWESVYVCVYACVHWHLSDVWKYWSSYLLSVWIAFELWSTVFIRHTSVSCILFFDTFSLYRSLSLSLSLDASDYQQPIVTQTTPLPSCIRHRKMDQRQREIRDDSSPEIKESSPDETDNHPPLTRPRTRSDTRRTTVVILDDDRTLKV